VSKLFDCRCRCADPRLLYVPVSAGLYAMNAYGFNPACTAAGSTGAMTSEDNTPTWTADVPDGFCEGRTPVTATMTATGLLPGEVVVVYKDNADVTIARYENLVAWQPNCYVQMNLTQWDESCGIVWDQHPCLYPHFTYCAGNDHPPSRCYCNDSLMSFRVKWTGVDDEYPLDDTVVEFIEDSPLVLECWRSMPSGAKAPGAFCHWSLTVGDSPAEIVVGVSYNDTTHTLSAVLYKGFGGITLGRASIPVPEGGAWCGETPWDAEWSVPGDPAVKGSVQITAVTVPNTLLVNADLTCPEGDQVSTCGGTSIWRLDAYSISPGVKRYYWTEVENTCDGDCRTKDCEPTVPFPLPSGDIPDETAEDYEILDLIGEEIEGDCGCVDPYDPPDNPDPCAGYSTWYLDRIGCGDLWLYYWQFVSSNCEGSCAAEENCNPQPPVSPVVSRSPVANNETLNGELGIHRTTGVCACDDPYEIPECGECEDCTDNLTSFSFFIPEIEGEFAAYDGSFGMSKTGVGENPCGWTGVNSELIPAFLTWESGLWTLVIGEDAAAVYEYEGGECETGFLMGKTIGDAVFPSALTVS